MCGIAATLCVILGRFFPLPDPLNSLQGRTPEQTDPLWSALARWLLTSTDKNRKHTSGHGKPQWGCLIGRWLSYCCPGSPDPGSVQGLGQDGWINNVCGSNVRNNESTGLVDTPNAGRYSVSGLSLWRETNLTRLPYMLPVLSWCYIKKVMKYQKSHLCHNFYFYLYKKCFISLWFLYYQ